MDSEFVKERRLRRLRSMFGSGPVVKVSSEDIRRQTDQSDDAVRATLIHPDGRVENLRMSRGGQDDAATA